MQHAVVLMESCCQHFAGVLFTGDDNECEFFAHSHDDDFPDGYVMKIVKVGHNPDDWRDLMPIEGVTVNGAPVERWQYEQD